MELSRSAAQRSIPDLDGRYLLIVAEHAQRTGIEQKVLPREHRQSDPARCEHAQNMSMRKQRDIARRTAGPRDDPVSARAHLRRRLASGTAIPEQQPIGRLFVNLLGRETLVRT